MPRKQFPTDKPYPSFPLTPRADGRFAKKVNGKPHTFGRNGNWREALDEYLAVARPLHAGAIVAPTEKPTRGPTVQQLANRYLDVRRRDVDSGIIKLGTWDDYRETVDHFLDFVQRGTPATEIRGEHLDRFGRHVLEKLKLSASRYHLYRANVRAWFTYAFNAGWIPSFPLGVHFKRIPKSKLRQSRKKRMLPAEHLRVLLDVAPRQLRAMILLALNGGMGNTDCSSLTKDAVDLTTGVVDYRRGKTGTERSFPLWDETREALAGIWNDRPADTVVFRTKYGNQWVRETVNKRGKVVTKDSIAQAFGDLADSFCIWTDDKSRRKTFAELHKGVGFYWLRHIHRTFSDEARDPHASLRIMGHEFPGMSDVYVEEISLARLRAVVSHVHARVFGHT